MFSIKSVHNYYKIYNLFVMAQHGKPHYYRPMNLHATCIAMDGYGILLRGPSGSGKSDLALRMIDQYTNVILVADDRVDVAAQRDAVYASVPASIAGKLEVRGIGIVEMPHAPRVKLVLLVDLVDAGCIPRMPEPAFEEILGVRLPRIALAPFAASAPAKLRQALRAEYAFQGKVQ